MEILSRRASGVLAASFAAILWGIVCFSVTNALKVRNETMHASLNMKKQKLELLLEHSSKRDKQAILKSSTIAQSKEEWSEALMEMAKKQGIDWEKMDVISDGHQKGPGKDRVQVTLQTSAVKLATWLKILSVESPDTIIESLKISRNMKMNHLEMQIVFVRQR